MVRMTQEKQCRGGGGDAVRMTQEKQRGRAGRRGRPERKVSAGRTLPGSQKAAGLRGTRGL